MIGITIDHRHRITTNITRHRRIARSDARPTAKSPG